MATSKLAPTACAARIIVFDKITVTGTEDLLMAAVLAEGETLMENCAREPEVTDLAALLVSHGCTHRRRRHIHHRVKGVSRLHGARHRINPDRIEAGTFLIAGAITGGDLTVAGCNPDHLGAVIGKLDEAGVRMRPESARTLSVSAPGAGCAPPTSRPKNIPASPPTCRRNTWRSQPRPNGVSVGHGKHLREPLHARAGTGPHGREHQG